MRPFKYISVWINMKIDVINKVMLPVEYEKLYTLKLARYLKWHPQAEVPVNWTNCDDPSWVMYIQVSSIFLN